ncbi:hypothetical protein [Bradyrhizobium sp. 172]|uniref:hypothetical protein n=1 Tax=Bradyrhizobium sp. 172 TaxID=2782643 RepID=UPI001FFF79A2|nr:hypothetical protein [Bradyrhizobium sp. 172]UPJ99470.1 hypothetical protein IVB07_19280 [Bradyrhizobium sp. 172]
MTNSKAQLPANIIAAVTSPSWWGPWFPNPESWAAWFTFWRTIFALPMSAEDLRLFQQCTGRDQPPSEPPREVAEIIGRRGGKSRGAATTAAWLALFLDWRIYLAPGEKAMVLLLAADRRQARVAFRFLRSLIVDHPELRKLVVSETQEAIELRNRVVIEVTTASFRTIRGYSIAALVADEIAFWFDGEASANPAEEVLAAARPAMATMGPSALLLSMSSPHARRGPLWKAFSRHYGKRDAPVLVWKAPSKTMNPSLPQSVIDEAYEQDPARASAEFGAEFRVDLESFLDRDAVEAVVVPDRFELPPVQGEQYHAFVDPSGGSGDSMTLCIAHRDGKCAVVDVVREAAPPFSPDKVVAEFSALLKVYGIRRAVGDKYAGVWPGERFQVYGIEYEPSARPKSELYSELLPLINGKRVELLDHKKLIAQLCSLERKTARGGRDTIDHPPNSHDDVANCVAGVVTSLCRPRIEIDTDIGGIICVPAAPRILW